MVQKIIMGQHVFRDQIISTKEVEIRQRKMLKLSSMKLRRVG